MKPLYESILNTDITKTTDDVIKSKKLCKDIARLLHKYFDKYTRNFKGTTFNGIEDGINQYGTGEWQTDWHRIEDSEGKCPTSGWGEDIAKKFTKDLRKIDGIKLEVDTHSDLPDFYYVWIHVLNFSRNSKVDVDDEAAAYPCIMFSFDSNPGDEPNALIAMPNIFLKK